MLTVTQEILNELNFVTVQKTDNKNVYNETTNPCVGFVLPVDDLTYGVKAEKRKYTFKPYSKDNDD